MPELNYIYAKPADTFTIGQFIACQSDTVSSYYNYSFIDKIEYPFMNEEIHYSTYNIASDYLDEIRDECLTIILSDEELLHYKYRPKLLANDIYNNGELAFLILLINDMYSIKQFNRKKIILPSKNNMAEICKQLFNANKTAITKYNNSTIY